MLPLIRRSILQALTALWRNACISLASVLLHGSTLAVDVQGDEAKLKKLLSTSGRILANIVDENRRRCVLGQSEIIGL